MARCITLSDKVCQWLTTGLLFSLGTAVSSTNKTGHHNITDKLLIEALKHHNSNRLTTSHVVMSEVIFSIYQSLTKILMNRIDGIIVSVLASSVIECGFEPRLSQTNQSKLTLAASPLGRQHYWVRTKTGWLKIRMMCPSGATYLLADCCFSELAIAL